MSNKNQELFTPLKLCSTEGVYFLFYILILSSPSVIHVINNFADKSFVVSILYIAFFISLLLLPLVFIRPFFWVLLTLPFLFITPSELIHIIHYDGFTTQAAFISAIETDSHEFAEFTNNYRLYYYGLIPLSVVISLLLLRRLRASCKIHLCLKLVIGIVFLTSISAFSLKTYTTNQEKNLKSVAMAMKELYSRLFTSNYPYAYFFRSHQYITQKIEFSNSKKMKDHFFFYTHVNKSFLDKYHPLVILVIGETSRAANWSLNDYSRNTNPLLGKRSDIFYSTNTIAAATHTRESIQLALTRATPHNLKPIFSEKSVISAFKESGFNTVWLSNQNMSGGVDTPVYFIAAEADHLAFIGGDYDLNSRFDEELLPYLDEILTNSTSEPTLLIIHTMGSHEVYRKRYPPKFKKFLPSSEGDDYNWNSPGIRERLINSYDNSILYTDYILNSMLDRLMKIDRPISFIYFSDHGENILDDGSSRFGHGGVIPTTYVTDIPMFLWFSENYLSLFPEKIENLRINNSNTKSTETIFDTLLDFYDIEINGYNLTNSILQSSYAPKDVYILNTSHQPVKYSAIVKRESQ